jgi:hypothetical protein
MTIGTRRLALVVAMTIPSIACMKWQKVGTTEAPMAPKEHVPLVCIEDRSGRDAEIVEGAAHGAAAVSVNEVRTGWSPTLDQPITVDDMQIYAGQSCVMLGKPVCDSAIYVRRGDRRYFLYWGDQYESANDVVTSPQALVQQFEKRGLIAAMRNLDVDDETAKQFVELSHARRSRQSWSLVKFLVGVSLQAAAPKLGSAEDAAKDTGSSMMKESLDVRFEIDESEKPVLEKNPKLAAVFAAAKLAAGGSDYRVASMCIGPLSPQP